MGMRYIIPAEDRTTVIVSKEILFILRLLAKQYDISITELTFNLLKLGLKSFNGTEVTDNNVIRKPRPENPQ